MFAVLSIEIRTLNRSLAAVLHATMQGTGCWMDVSMTASLLAHNIMPLCAVQAQGAAPRPEQALLNGGVPCYRVYGTADGKHLAVGALELKFWQNFCQALGLAEYAQQHWSLGSHEAGDGASAALSLEVQRLIDTKPLAYWAALFDGVDCCATPVLRLDEAVVHSANTAYGSVGLRSAANGRTVSTVDFAMKTIR